MYRVDIKGWIETDKADEFANEIFSIIKKYGEYFGPPISITLMPQNIDYQKQEENVTENKTNQDSK